MTFALFKVIAFAGYSSMALCDPLPDGKYRHICEVDKLKDAYIVLELETRVKCIKQESDSSTSTGGTNE